MSSLPLRRGFFYLYILLFLLTSPLVVLYTAGYRFDFHTTSFVKTGALAVSTDPRGAHVVLNDDSKLTRTPSILKNILPGTYTLQVSKDGYHEWQREITVRSRETTMVDEVLLFQNEQQATVIFEKNVRSIASADANDRFVYVDEGRSWFEIWEVDSQTLEQTLHDRLAVSSGLTAEEALRLSLHPALSAYTFTPRADGILFARASRSLALLPDGTYRAVQEAGNLVLIMQEDGKALLLVDTATDGPPILLNTQATFFHWDEQGLIYGDGLEVHHALPEHGSDTLITRSGDMVLDARIINSHTFLLTFADRVVAYDISDPAHSVSTTLLSAAEVLAGVQIKDAWLAENKKTAFIAAQDLTIGSVVLSLKLQ